MKTSFDLLEALPLFPIQRWSNAILGSPKHFIGKREYPAHWSRLTLEIVSFYFASSIRPTIYNTRFLPYYCWIASLHLGAAFAQTGIANNEIEPGRKIGVWGNWWLGEYIVTTTGVEWPHAILPCFHFVVCPMLSFSAFQSAYRQLIPGISS